MSEPVRVNALILRERVMGEGDKLLTMLTAERGKIYVYGYGVRSNKNRNIASTQPMCYGEYELEERFGSYRLKEGFLNMNFYDIRRDIETFALSQYVLETIDDAAQPENREPELLRLALNTLYALNLRAKAPDEDKKPSALIKGAYELRLAAIEGFLPELDRCMLCGTRELMQEAYLDVMNGGVLCGKCLEARTECEGVATILLPLAEGTLPALKYVIGCPLKKLYSFRLNEKTLENFSSVCEKYLLNQFERTYTTLDFYRKVTRK